MCLHGAISNIKHINSAFFAGAMDRSVIFARAAASRVALLLAGFCHAHSNCSACVFDANPETMSIISHGLISDVYLAPLAMTPLCCANLLGGSLVKPT